MNNSDTPKLIFEYGFDERDQCEAKDRGYLNYVRVLLRNGYSYSVVFYDHVRLGQDLEEETKLDHRFIAEPGMIVLPEVTLENMQTAVNKLEQEGFFNRIVPNESTHRQVFNEKAL
jgi:thymidylate kinase